MNKNGLQPDSPWPHRVAVLLVCATFPLIWVGGLVTTTDAGMAVPDWPNTYGENMFLYDWAKWFFGPWDLFVEHGHRLLASLVGVITIALVLVTWLKDKREWMRWVVLAALVAVVVQGFLGGLRVILDARTVAKIHGCLGPAFFALCVAIAVVTSRRWMSSHTAQKSEHAGSLHKLALLTSFITYVQLVLGAQLRHISDFAKPGEFRTLVVFHLLVAFVLLLHVVMLLGTVVIRYRTEKALLVPVLILGLLMFLQLYLGASTWLVKYGVPGFASGWPSLAGYTISASSFSQSLIVTAHQATGSLILGFAVLVVLRGYRLLRPARQASQTSLAEKPTKLLGVAL